MVDKAYLFEVGVGRGAVLATSLRFTTDAVFQTHPQSDYFLGALLAYAAGEDFRPKQIVPRGVFERAIAR